MGGMGSGADGKRTVGVGKKRKEKWESWSDGVRKK